MKAYVVRNGVGPDGKPAVYAGGLYHPHPFGPDEFRLEVEPRGDGWSEVFSCSAADLEFLRDQIDLALIERRRP